MPGHQPPPPVTVRRRPAGAQPRARRRRPAQASPAHQRPRHPAAARRQGARQQAAGAHAAEPPTQPPVDRARVARRPPPEVLTRAEPAVVRHQRHRRRRPGAADRHGRARRRRDGPVRRARRWPRVITAGLHRNLSLLVGGASWSLHVLTTVPDSYAPIGWIAAVVPFTSAYRPFWLGLGAIAFDLLLAVTITSLLRARLSLPGLAGRALARLRVLAGRALARPGHRHRQPAAWLLALDAAVRRRGHRRPRLADVPGRARAVPARSPSR